MKRLILGLGILVLAVLVIMQLIPVARTNPPVTREVKWDSAQTRDLAKRACYDCHSNETAWPWYAAVAPVKFVLANHINEGRQRLNFSTWDQPNGELEEVQESIQDGKMPLWDYLLMHPEAKLSAAEQGQLIAGLRATFQQDPPVAGEREGRGGGGGDD